MLTELFISQNTLGRSAIEPVPCIGTTTGHHVADLTPAFFLALLIYFVPAN